MNNFPYVVDKVFPSILAYICILMVSCMYHVHIQEVLGNLCTLVQPIPNDNDILQVIHNIPSLDDNLSYKWVHCKIIHPIHDDNCIQMIHYNFHAGIPARGYIFHNFHHRIRVYSDTLQVDCSNLALDHNHAYKLVHHKGHQSNLACI